MLALLPSLALNLNLRRKSHCGSESLVILIQIQVAPPGSRTLFSVFLVSAPLNVVRLPAVTVETSKKVQDDIVANVTPESATFANTIQPLVQDENYRLYDRELIGLYSSVSTDESMRNASSEASGLFSIDVFVLDVPQRLYRFKVPGLRESLPRIDLGDILLVRPFVPSLSPNIAQEAHAWRWTSLPRQ